MKNWRERYEILIARHKAGERLTASERRQLRKTGARMHATPCPEGEDPDLWLRSHWQRPGHRMARWKVEKNGKRTRLSKLRWFKTEPMQNVRSSRWEAPVLMCGKRPKDLCHDREDERRRARVVS